MSNIIVAGAGHGGVVAAMKLAKLGHSVTVYERSSYERLGLPHKDTFDESAMEFAGLEVPESWRAPNNIITLIPLDGGVEPLTLPEAKDARSLIVERKELIRHLISLAEEAGVSFVYGEEILAPVMLGSRVAGVVTSGGVRYCDLVIDACGVHSPLRRAMPEFTRIQNEAGRFDVLHTYRAYYEKLEGEQEPATPYNIILKCDGTVGFSWLITESDAVDVLIARFPETDVNGFCEPLNELYEENAHMGKRLLRGGLVTDIPVRQPLAVFVADGYAAVGDSAFMTYAVKGSGIAYSLIAGTLLANAIEQDKDCLFNCDTLWEYEKAFFKQIGFDACRTALMKNLLPYLTAKEVSDLFAAKVITTEELAELNSGSLGSMLNSQTVAKVKEKLRLLKGMPQLRKKLLDMVVWFGKLAMIEPFFPQKYERDSVAKWAERYNEFFESIKYHPADEGENQGE